jgi:hypothetical protein
LNLSDPLTKMSVRGDQSKLSRSMHVEKTPPRACPTNKSNLKGVRQLRNTQRDMTKY